MKKATLHFVLVYILMQWGGSPLLAAGAGSFLPFLPDEAVPAHYHTSAIIRDTLGFTQIPVAVGHIDDLRRIAFYQHACTVLDTIGEEAMEKEFNEAKPLIESYKTLFEKIAAGTVKMTETDITHAKDHIITLVKSLWILSEKGYGPASDLVFKIFTAGLCGMPEDKRVSGSLCHRPDTSAHLRQHLWAFKEQERINAESDAKDAEERRSSGETIVDSDEPEDGVVRKFSAYGGAHAAAEVKAALLDGSHKKGV